MHSLRLAGPRIAAPAAALALLFLAAGCASDADGPRPPHGAPARQQFSTVGGQETFFNGTITADVLVGAMTGFRAGNPGAGPGGGGGGRRHHGGGGGGMHHGGGGGPEGPGGEGGGTDSGGSSELRRADAMGSPPVMIHLRFTNKGAEHADLVIADFLSPLGNFVVTPEKLALDPGQSLEVEPMTSRLAGDVTSGAITLSLKLGSAQETKTITLELKPEPAAPAAPDTKP